MVKTWIRREVRHGRLPPSRLPDEDRQRIAEAEMDRELAQLEKLAKPL